jgi:hypothetical protein
LEVFDVESEMWVAAERLCGTKSLDATCRDAIIFGGHMLEELTQGGVRACRHLVTKCQHPRFSSVYELRADSAFKALVLHNCGVVAPVASSTSDTASGGGGGGGGSGASPGSTGGVVAEKDREMSEAEVQAQLRRLGIIP